MTAIGYSKRPYWKVAVGRRHRRRDGQILAAAIAASGTQRQPAALPRAEVQHELGARPVELRGCRREVQGRRPIDAVKPGIAQHDRIGRKPLDKAFAPSRTLHAAHSKTSAKSAPKRTLNVT